MNSSPAKWWWIDIRIEDEESTYRFRSDLADSSSKGPGIIPDWRSGIWFCVTCTPPRAEGRRDEKCYTRFDLRRGSYKRPMSGRSATASLPPKFKLSCKRLLLTTNHTQFLHTTFHDFRARMHTPRTDCCKSDCSLSSKDWWEKRHPNHLLDSRDCSVGSQSSAWLTAWSSVLARSRAVVQPESSRYPCELKMTLEYKL